jgi:hypothetical protein
MQNPNPAWRLGTLDRLFSVIATDYSVTGIALPRAHHVRVPHSTLSLVLSHMTIMVRIDRRARAWNGLSLVLHLRAPIRSA